MTISFNALAVNFSLEPFTNKLLSSIFFIKSSKLVALSIISLLVFSSFSNPTSSIVSSKLAFALFNSSFNSITFCNKAEASSVLSAMGFIFSSNCIICSIALLTLPSAISLIFGKVFSNSTNSSAIFIVSCTCDCFSLPIS